MNVDLLISTRGPWVMGYVGKIDSLHQKLKEFENGFDINIINAKLMHDFNGVYREIKSKFKLPEYFGNNLDALEECLSDPDIISKSGYIIVIRNADELLCSEAGGRLHGLIATLSGVGETWSQSASTPQDHAAIPFHTVFQFDQRAASSILPLEELEL